MILNKSKLGSLLQKRDVLIKDLPSIKTILRGSLIKRYLPCGKLHCKCNQGKLHGPMVYVVCTISKSKTKQVYIKKNIRDCAKLGIKIYNKWWQTINKISKINFELLRMGVDITKNKIGGLK